MQAVGIKQNASYSHLSPSKRSESEPSGYNFYTANKTSQVSFGLFGLEAFGISAIAQAIGLSGLGGWLIGRTKLGKPSKLVETIGKVLRAPLNLFKNIFMGKKQ